MEAKNTLNKLSRRGFLKGIGGVAIVAGTQASATKLILANPHFAVELDKKTGALVAIWDKDQNLAYRLRGSGFLIITDRGEIRSIAATKVEKTTEGATFSFDAQGFKVNLYYRLGPTDKFFEKWLDIKSKDGSSYFLKEVVLEDVRALSQFREIHFHDDETIWHCPINLFLRSRNGGCYAGLEYPWWSMELRGKEGFRIGYKPNYPVKQAEVNTSEKFFWGVFRKEGIHRFSQGPYPGKVPAEFLTFENSGLNQHFKDGKVHVAPVKPEVLDWGEVWAMQDFMRYVLPEYPSPEEGYWIWQNGWWAGLFNPKHEYLDRLKEAGITDIMTAHTWYGHGNHPMPEPYLWNMKTSPMMFPIARTPVKGPAEEVAAAPKAFYNFKDPGHEYDNPTEFEPEFCAPAVFEDLRAYGEKIGVHVSSFSLPGLFFNDRPDWASIDEDGNVSVYIFGRKVACPANDEYMEFMQRLYDRVFDKYKPRYWAWDGRWVSYWEVCYYRPGPKLQGPDPCYAKNHGHLPGDNFYREWRNIMRFMEHIRQRYPRMCLEAYAGLDAAGPWGLRYVNGEDGYYESNGADMNRFQTWQNQNGHFQPPYLNYAAIFGKGVKDFQLNVISTLSATRYTQIGPGFEGLALKENQEFLKKWRAWAGRNAPYLRVKRDLFDCPGYSRVDGSAHIIKDQGFIFLFPGGLDTSDPKIAEKVLALPKTARASIILNRWIGLAENTGARFKLSEVFPREGRVLGIFRYGEEFLYDMPRDSAVILSLQPAKADEKAERAAISAPAEDTVVVKAFSSTLPHLLE